MPATSPTTSMTLLDCLREPNQPGAWERFVRLYTPLLHEWTRRQGFHEADRADLTQEILLKLLKELPRYDVDTHRSFRGWLFAVATNQGRDFRRRRATRGLPGADGLSGRHNGEHHPCAEIEEAEYARYLVHRGLALIRGEFEEPTFRAFEGCKLAGRPPAAVAAELGLTPNAVYVACNRVWTRLRQELAGLVN